MLPSYGSINTLNEFPKLDLNILKILKTNKSQVDFDLIQELINEIQLNNFKQNFSIEVSRFLTIFFN